MHAGYPQASRAGHPGALRRVCRDADAVTLHAGPGPPVRALHVVQNDIDRLLDRNAAHLGHTAAAAANAAPAPAPAHAAIAAAENRVRARRARVRPRRRLRVRAAGARPPGRVEVVAPVRVAAACAAADHAGPPPRPQFLEEQSPPRDRVQHRVDPAGAGEERPRR